MPQRVSIRRCGRKLIISWPRAKTIARYTVDTYSGMVIDNNYGAITPEELATIYKILIKHNHNAVIAKVKEFYA